MLNVIKKDMDLQSNLALTLAGFHILSLKRGGDEFTEPAHTGFLQRHVLTHYLHIFNEKDSFFSHFLPAVRWNRSFNFKASSRSHIMMAQPEKAEI